MVTKASEYRKGKVVEITLPSTMESGEHPVFKIRKPSAKVLAALLDVLGIEVSEDVDKEKAKAAMNERIKTPEGKRSLALALQEVVCGSVVEPVITTGIPTENEIPIDEVDTEDQIFVVNEVMKLAGYSEETEAEREKFRPEPSQETGGDSGAAVGDQAQQPT